MDTWTATVQATSKATAIKHGETWTSADMELVSAFEGEALAELARATGRTYFAVSTMKGMIAAGKQPTARVAITDRPYRGWVESQGDE